MTAKAPRPRKPSAKAAKDEMLALHDQIAGEIEARREADMSPEARLEDKAAKAAVAAADALTTDTIVQDIAKLKSELNRVLADTAEKLEGLAAQYQQLKRAVAAQEKELQEIYEIRRCASTLTALLEAQQQKREEFEAEMAARRQELEAEVARARAEWDAEKKAHEQAVRERDAAEAKERARQREDFEYRFKREQQIAREQFEDEKKRLERELAARRAQLEAEWSAREAALAAQAQELETLREKAQRAPQELQVAVDRAVKETTERLQREARLQVELLQKESAGEKNVLLARIDALERTVKDQAAQIAKLTQQLERAYAQVQDIAVKTVEGTAAAKSMARLETLVGETARRSVPDKT